MKNQIKLFAALAAVLWAFSAGAVTYPWYNAPAPIWTNSESYLNSTVPTNGQYTAGIAASTGEANLVLLSANDPDNVVTFQFTGAGTTATMTNWVVTLSATIVPALVTNLANYVTNASGVVTNTYYGAAQSAATRATFATVTIGLNGTTPVCTNITFSPYSTPPFNGKMSIYVESMTNTSTAGAITNWSIYPSQ